jgi:hypothetical protein
MSQRNWLGISGVAEMKIEQGSLYEVVQEKLASNPLIREIQGILKRVTNFREQARSFYFEVILSVYNCPKCSGRLRMLCQSQCACSCGNTFDPTLAFQKSICCSARLIRKTFHYACSQCQKTVPSRFLFDEKVFDKSYFREMMNKSRRKAKQKRDEIRRLLAESRSGVLPLIETPDLHSIPGLLHDLDNFIQQSKNIEQHIFDIENNFNMDEYRNHVLAILTWNRILFSNIAPLAKDHRRDKVQRFITLIFMEHDREIELTQDQNDIWVQKVYNETYT